MSAHIASQKSENPRVEALRKKHQALSEQIEDAQKKISISDFYVQDLKKQKLLVKEQLHQETKEA